MNSGSDNKEDASKSEGRNDLGGGGDLTFHLMKEAHQSDIIANIELLDNNSNSGGNMKPGSQPEVKTGLDVKSGDDKGMEESSLCVESDTKMQQENERKELDETDETGKNMQNSNDVEEIGDVEQEEKNNISGKETVMQDGSDDKDTELSDNSKAQEEKKDDLQNARIFDRQQRSNVYNKACILLQEGQTDKALKCFVAAITGLTKNNSFHELPQCLHQVSNIYFEQNEFEKAVHFIQAEKMYYETALLDIVNLQKELAEKRKNKQVGEVTSSESNSEDAEKTSKDPQDLEPKDMNPEMNKAREFENLARLCLKEGKPQLALEYCGKATKTFRSQLGDDHPVTIGSLDLFALIYADVGKKLYEDAMKKFGVDEENEDSKIKVNLQQGSSTDAQDGSANTIGIRKRNVSGKETISKTNQRTSEQRHVHFEEYEPSPPEQDDWVTTVLLMILFFLITVLFALIFCYFYCRNNDRSKMCAGFKGDLTYWYMKLLHTFKYYTSSGRR